MESGSMISFPQYRYVELGITVSYNYLIL